MCVFFLTQAFTQGAVYCRAKIMLFLNLLTTELCRLFKPGKEKCISQCPRFLYRQQKLLLKESFFAGEKSSLKCFNNREKKKVVRELAGPMRNTFLICAFVTSRADCYNLLYIAKLPGAWGKTPLASKKVAACLLSETRQSETVIAIQFCLRGFLGIDTSCMSLPSYWKIYLGNFLSSHNHWLSHQPWFLW